jgi:hypothetical protein
MYVALEFTQANTITFGVGVAMCRSTARPQSSEDGLIFGRIRGVEFGRTGGPALVFLVLFFAWYVRFSVRRRGGPKHPDFGFEILFFNSVAADECDRALSLAGPLSADTSTSGKSDDVTSE